MPETPDAQLSDRAPTAPQEPEAVVPAPAAAAGPAPEPVGTAPAAAAGEPQPEPAPQLAAAVASGGAGPAPGPAPLHHPVKRHHGIVRVTHWANAVLLAGMIGSGLQIYGAFPRFGPRGGPSLSWNPWEGEVFPRAVRLGGWLAGGINWHFALAWPFVLTGLVYLAYLAFSGEWRALLFRPRDLPRVWQMQLYYLRLRREHPPQGKHNALQKAAYGGIVVVAALAVGSGFAIYKPVQLAWLVAAFGGFELARWWHFWTVWVFVAFVVVHVAMVLLVDPASLRAMVTGWYRGRFPSHD